MTVLIALLVFLFSAQMGDSSALGGSPEYTLGASQVEILSPREDAVIASSTVQIVFRFLKGRKDSGEHLHLLLDGEKWGTVKSSPVTLKNLSPGPHSVTLQMSTRDHVLLGDGTTVRFVVETSK
ncbi:MAG: hypothetical protein HZA18_07295 [Nitrospirae bacterium]|nr:hypothetical protein [Nitrospirota bacterium]